MGIGSYRFLPKTGKTEWFNATPAVVGNWDEDSYYENISRIAEFQARDLRDLVTYWQIANEPDVEIFHGDMTEEQVERFLRAAAYGLKRGNPNAKVGTNLGGTDAFALKLARRLCREDGVFDYIGIDGYLGSWHPGGPRDWNERIDTVWEAAGKPVIVLEWGYATLESGPNPDPEGKRFYNQDVCRTKHWGREQHWDGREHSEESQADFIRETMQIFRDHPAVQGEFFFRWRDTETCWQCGDPLCPSECSWGITDVHGKPKKGYYALKESVEKLFRQKGHRYAELL